MHKFAAPLLLIAPALVATPSVEAQASAPREFILNGGFETGSFESWIVSMVTAGDWTINDGTLVIPGNGVTSPPQNGSFDATTVGTGPGVRVLQQCFTIPPIVNSATLSWTDEIRNFHTAFVDPTQEFRVYIQQVGSMNPPIEIFSTNPGNTLIQPSTQRSFDVTADLQALAGQDVCVVFEEEDNLFFFNLSLDDVSLIIDTPSSRASFTSFGDGCGPVGGPAVGLEATPGSLPILGSTFQADVTDVPLNSAAGAILVGGLPQAIDLGPLGAPGCSLLTTGVVSVPFSPMMPTTTVDIPLPNNLTLLGINGYLQAALLVPAINSLNAVSSNGGLIVLGDV